MNVRYERQLKKGVLEILALQMISRQDMYGYQIIQELRNTSHEMFTLKEGTLYPILYRLEDDGMVESHWSKPIGKEVSKKYYSITDKGSCELQELKRLWLDFSSQVTSMLEESE